MNKLNLKPLDQKQQKKVAGGNEPIGMCPNPSTLPPGYGVHNHPER